MVVDVAERVRLPTGVPRNLTTADADDRTRQARGSQRRQEILDAAVELFSTKGYRGTGIGALAERVGLTDAGVLYYFGSKERLLHEVVAERTRATPPDAIDTWTLADLKTVGPRIADEEHLTRLYLVLNTESLNSDEPLHDFFAHRHRAGIQFLVHLLENEQARGNIRAGLDLHQIAAEVLGLSLGLQLIGLTDASILDAVAVFNAHIDRLIVELAPDDP